MSCKWLSHSVLTDELVRGWFSNRLWSGWKSCWTTVLMWVSAVVQRDQYSSAHYYFRSLWMTWVMGHAALSESVDQSRGAMNTQGDCVTVQKYFNRLGWKSSRLTETSWNWTQTNGNFCIRWKNSMEYNRLGADRLENSFIGKGLRP